MNPRIINQGDPRWASLPYRTLPYTVQKEGCGLCAVTMCAMELDKYWNYTPKDTIGFMRPYATNGNGTEWAGIDAGLKKYVGNYKRHYNMSSFWDEVSKGNRVGVILFGSNTAPDGTVWTRGGHYVMFAKYKYENGQHWLYTKDSSYRHNDGWHSYERSMRGCIPDVLWTCALPDIGKLTPDGDFGRKSTIKLQKILKVSQDGYIYGQKSELKKYLLNWTVVNYDDGYNGSGTIQALQTFLKNRKFFTGRIDGICGKYTIMSLQKFLDSAGFYKGRFDGVFGEYTATCLQKWMNEVDR